MKQQISTSFAPKAIGPYSQGIYAGNMVFTSGQLPIDVKTGHMVEDIEKQAITSLDNVKAILSSAGCSMDDVVKTVIFITDMNYFEAVNKVYERYFNVPYPSRSCIQVAGLPMGADVEIEAIALKKD